LRFLYHAFFARPDIPLLRLPWNALGVVAAGVAGFWDPSVWMVAGIGELIYLFTLASNSGFQNFIDAQRAVALHGDSEDSRKRLLSKIGGAARQRYVKLEEKRARLEQLNQEAPGEDLFAESNAEALRKLTWLYLNLLVAERNLIVAPASDARDLEKQIKAYEQEKNTAPSEGARTSHEATLRLLRERLDNIRDKEVSLAEIDADLARIETQLDLAIEEATLRGRPAAISANVELTSRLLGNIDDSSSTYSAMANTSSRQIE
jgi:hypothetical protein